MQSYSGPWRPAKGLLFSLARLECRVCWVTSAGFRRALSLTFVCPGHEICVCVLLPFLSVAARVLMETRIPGGPHIKTRGIAALGFQTNITHFLCCLRDRGGMTVYLQRISPAPPRPTHTHNPTPPHHPSVLPPSLFPLSPSTSLPPHPTGAAKSKCQSRSGRCIPSRGQLVVATEGSVACFRLFVKKKPRKKKNFMMGTDLLFIPWV